MAKQKFEQSSLEKNRREKNHGDINQSSDETPASRGSLNRLLFRRHRSMDRGAERSPQSIEEISDNPSAELPLSGMPLSEPQPVEPQPVEPQPVEPQPVEPQPVEKPVVSKSWAGRSKIWNWSLVWLALLGIFGGMGTCGAAVVNHAATPCQLPEPC